MIKNNRQTALLPTVCRLFLSVSYTHLDVYKRQSLIYYLALAVLRIPYITFGILSWSLTISNFEVCTFIFLVAMMLYLGVRRIPVLAAVPLGTTLFLSVAFRAMLHVLLP